MAEGGNKMKAKTTKANTQSLVWILKNVCDIVCAKGVIKCKNNC